MDQRDLYKNCGYGRNTRLKTRALITRQRSENRQNLYSHGREEVISDSNSVSITANTNISKKQAYLLRFVAWQRAKKKLRETPQAIQKPFVSTVPKNTFLMPESTASFKKKRKCELRAPKEIAVSMIFKTTTQTNNTTVKSLNFGGPLITSTAHKERIPQTASIGLISPISVSCPANFVETPLAEPLANTITATPLSHVTENVIITRGRAQLLTNPVREIGYSKISNLRHRTSAASSALNANHPDKSPSPIPGPSNEMPLSPKINVMPSTVQICNDVAIGENCAAKMPVVEPRNSFKQTLPPLSETKRDDSVTTPTSPQDGAVNNFVSPLVTIRRGKGSARKEKTVYREDVHQSMERSGENKQLNKVTAYFRNQLNAETERLLSLVSKWEHYKTEHASVIGTEYVDLIDVTIGQTRLLVSKKFNQFRSLIEKCEDGTGGLPVLPDDLDGFWSMVFIQIDNCNARFAKLDLLQRTNWLEENDSIKKVPQKSNKVLKVPMKLRNGKAVHIQAMEFVHAQQRLKREQFKNEKSAKECNLFFVDLETPAPMEKLTVTPRRKHLEIGYKENISAVPNNTAFGVTSQSNVKECSQRKTNRLALKDTPVNISQIKR